MRISKQLPKRGEFWDRYAGLVPTLNKLSYLTQLISFLSELSVFYLLIKPKVQEVAPDHAHGIAIAGALVVALTVEIGVRTFFPYTVKTVLYRRWSGLDLPMSLFIWAFTLGLFGVSLFTSFQGSHDVVYDAMTTGKSRDRIEQTLTGETESILKRFAADSLQTAQSYDGQIIALREAENAAVTAKREQLRSIEKREAATGQSYLSQKSKLREAIAAITAENAAKIADLQSKKADALSTLLAKRETKTGEAKDLASNGVAHLEQKGTKYGGWVAWFTVICHAFLAIAITMNEIVKKGSDIQEKPILSTFHFDPSVVAEWWGVLSNKYQVWARTKIRTWAEKTPEPPKPGALPVLYEHEPQQPRVVIGGFMPNGSITNAASNSSANAGGTNATISNASPFVSNCQHCGNGFETFDKSVITCDECLGKAANEATNGNTPNATISMGQKQCELPSCGAAFTPKVNWQKYCCQTHQMQHHAEKHGKPFDPAKFHNKKP
ncbi:MAG: hypothetical protein ACK4TA_00115 [Saprospiraceae bacterium]